MSDNLPTTGEQEYCLPDALVDKMNPKHPTTGEWTARGLASLWSDIGWEGIADAINAALAAEREKHCRDCCCAQSWKALGITGRTGISIPEHIQQLREQLATAVEALELAKRHLEATTQALGEFTTSADVEVLIQIDAVLAGIGEQK